MSELPSTALRLSLLSLLLVAVSCDSSPSTRAQADAAGDGAPASDAGTADTATADGGVTDSTPGDLPPLAPRAVVVTLHRAASGDGVAIMTLDSAGKLVDLNARFNGVAYPRAVVMRPDGREALVAWGKPSTAYGVTTYRFDEGGANATEAPPLELGSGKVPVSVTYVTDTLALVTLVDETDGDGPNEVVALERAKADEPFKAGAAANVIQDWPLAAAADSGGGAYVLRGDGAGSSEIIAMEHSVASGWAAAGTPGQVTPPSRQIATAGARVYCPTADPAKPVTATDLVGAGKLLSFSKDASGMKAEPTFDLPAPGSAIVADPAGRYLVIAATQHELGASNQPQARGLKWLTVELDGVGAPTKATLGQVVQPALVVRSLALTSDGILVTAIEPYQDQAKTPLEVYPVTAWQRQGDDWVATAAPVHMDGQAMVAIAP